MALPGVGAFAGVDRQRRAIEVSGAADLDRRAAAVGVDAIGQGRAAAHAQVAVDAGGAQRGVGLQGAVHHQAAHRAAAGIHTACVDRHVPDNAALVDQLGTAGNLAAVAEVTLAGQRPGALLHVQPFEVAAVAKSATGDVVQGQSVVTAAAVHRADKAATVAQDQLVIAAAQIQGQAITAADRAAVDDRIGIVADELHAKAIQAFNRAVVLQGGGREPRPVAAVVHQDGIVGTTDQRAFGVVERATAQGDPFAAVGEAVLVDTPGADALDNTIVFDMGDLVDVHTVTVAIRLQPGERAGDGAVVDHSAVAIGTKARAVAADHRAVVGQRGALVRGDAMAATGNQTVVGDRHAAGGVDVHTIELVIAGEGVAGGDLTVVSD